MEDSTLSLAYWTLFPVVRDWLDEHGWNSIREAKHTLLLPLPLGVVRVHSSSVAPWIGAVREEFQAECVAATVWAAHY